MTEQVIEVGEFKVGISDYKVAASPHSLVTIGLGSCIGIALYEPVTRIGGLSHIMLPDSEGFKDRSKWQKFADLAIPKMAEEIRTQSGKKYLVAKIAGGASMFRFDITSTSLQIGERNILAVKEALGKSCIPLLGEHTGGNMGRTMIVDLSTFEVTVRMVNRERFVL